MGGASWFSVILDAEKGRMWVQTRSCKDVPFVRDLHERGCSTHTRYPTSTAPPFTLNTSPVMNPEYCEQRKSTGPAISSAVATRPNGIAAKIRLLVAGSFSAAADISVLTQPGATELT